MSNEPTYADDPTYKAKLARLEHLKIRAREILAKEERERTKYINLEYFQAKIAEFVISTWGEAAMDSRPERAARVLEEAVELAQAEGLPLPTILKIVARIHERPPSAPEDEAGDVLFTLLAWAWTADGADLHQILLTRLARVNSIPPNTLRARHDAKRAAGTILFDGPMLEPPTERPR